MKVKDLSPEFKKLLPAFKELSNTFLAQESGQEFSGNSLFSDVFRRGKGENLFGPFKQGISAITGSNQQYKTGFSSLNEAISWVNSQGGGKIFISIGTYIIDQSIELFSNIIIEGEDDELTVLDFQNKRNNFFAKGAATSYKYNIELRKFKIINSAISEQGAIDLFYSRDCTIEKVKFENTFDLVNLAAVCIKLRYCTGVTISNNKFVNNDDALEVSYSNRIFIEFNYFDSIDGLLIYFSNSPATIFRHNYIVDCGRSTLDSLVYYGSNSNNSVIDSNHFLSCLCTPIWTEDGSEISIINNYFTNNVSADNAIALSSANRCIISSNKIVGFKHDGISLSSSDKNVITENVVSGCGAYGVLISNSACDKNVIVGNSLSDNTSGAYSDSGTGTIISGNAS